MKALTPAELEALFESLESAYDVRVPIALHDGTRSLGRPGQGLLALAGGAVPAKVTAVFFPQVERVLTAGPDGVKAPPAPAKPLFVVGFTAQDADCLEFIDRFFSENYRDDIYFAKRDGAIVVCVSGRCGKDGQFLKIAGGKCDLELICDGQKYLVAAYSQAGRALADKIEAGQETPPESLEELKRQSEALPTDDEELIQAASRLLLAGKVPDEFWEGVADRCIACTSCNLVCPTCTCFEVYDRKVGRETHRYRMWDSCQFDGFMREASGHNPMGREGLRTQRRIHHKLAADVTRWGHVTCYLCGRCDDICPTGIGIKAVCREMLEKYGTA